MALGGGGPGGVCLGDNVVAAAAASVARVVGKIWWVAATWLVGAMHVA